jgi:SAM-dependent methyltransferase
MNHSRAARRRVVGALDALGLRDTARLARDGLRLAQSGDLGLELQAVRSMTVPSTLPPARLVYLVTGRVSRLNYHESGRRAADHFAQVLELVGRKPEIGDRVLDFGCGCGRILRWWDGSPASFYGCDYNPDLVAWCAAHLPLAAVRTNSLEPPTGFESDFFDIIYAHSVLTHLVPSAQERWMQEWARMLRPSGVVLATTLGPTTCWQPGEPESLEAHGTIVKSAQRNGENLCSVYNSATDVRCRLARSANLELIAERPADMPDSGQDIWVFQKPDPT